VSLCLYVSKYLGVFVEMKKKTFEDFVVIEARLSTEVSLEISS
jgi:hypothetical protein